jgi:hypothetical protein
MKRSSSSLTSINSMPSINSINSLTKIFNNRDFQKYIANMEEDIIKISNDYYYFTQKYDTKIDNIINRYDGKTNKLFIDLRNRECDYERFNKKIENIIKDLQEYKKFSNDKSVYISITKDVDDLKNILIFLYVYTSLVFAIIINYSISK